MHYLYVVVILFNEHLYKSACSLILSNFYLSCFQIDICISNIYATKCSTILFLLYLKRQRKQCLKEHASRNILSFSKTFYLKSMIYESFSLISFWYQQMVFGIGTLIEGIKNNIRTSFKSLASKNLRTLLLKRTSG